MADSPVVVNTGPLLALSACGQIDLLRRMHAPVIIPQPVLEELTRTPRTVGAGGGVLAPPPWAEVRALSGPVSPFLQAYLDPGEAAVIALAIELHIPLALIDERRGRMVARTMGLTVSGSVGVILRAKKEGHLASVRACIDAMRAQGVWLSEPLIAFALREAGEAP